MASQIRWSRVRRPVQEACQRYNVSDESVLPFRLRRQLYSQSRRSARLDRPRIADLLAIWPDSRGLRHIRRPPWADCESMKDAVVFGSKLRTFAGVDWGATSSKEHFSLGRPDLESKGCRHHRLSRRPRLAEGMGRGWGWGGNRLRALDPRGRCHIIPVRAADTSTMDTKDRSTQG